VGAHAPKSRANTRPKTISVCLRMVFFSFFL
jgi:hypothetical protein